MTMPTPQAQTGPTGAKILPCLLLAAALALLPLSSECLAAEKADKSQTQAAGQTRGQDAKKAGPKAQPWAFGGGRSASTWANRGVDGSSMQKNATALQPKSGKDAAAPQKSTSGKSGGPLLAGEGFAVSVDEERQGWTASPSRAMHADEDKSSDTQHRVRAFATHQDDNLTIGLGPEFVVKDTNEATPVFKKNHDQPDVDAGLGMQFKIDF